MRGIICYITHRFRCERRMPGDVIPPTQDRREDGVTGVDFAAGISDTALPGRRTRGRTRARINNSTPTHGSSCVQINPGNAKLDR